VFGELFAGSGLLDKAFILAVGKCGQDVLHGVGLEDVVGEGGDDGRFKRLTRDAVPDAVAVAVGSGAEVTIESGAVLLRGGMAIEW